MVEFIIKNQNTNVKVAVAKKVENPTNTIISSPTKDLIARLLLEKISLASIARSTGVSQKWLQDYVNNKYASIERRVKVTPKKKLD